MKIFGRRPLCLGCATFVLAIILGINIPFIFKIILSAFSLVSFIALLFINKPFNRNKLTKLTLCVLAIMLFLGSFVSLLYYDLYLGYRDEFVGQDRDVEAIVVKEVKQTEDFSAYEIQITSIDGKAYFTRGNLTFPENVELNIGDKVSLFTDIIKIEDHSEIGEYASSYFSKGVFLALECDTYEDCIVSSDKAFIPTTVFYKINNAISDHLFELLGEDSGALGSALLLGNDHLLEDNVIRDFRRIGVSHILALSGLHVAVVAGFIDFVLKKLYLGKTLRCIVILSVLFLYLFVTGFAPSTVRAIVMLGLLYVAYFFKGDSDPLTNLFVAISLIILVSPNAIYDAGMWLSFLSVLGLLTVLPYFTELVEQLLERVSKIRVLYKPLKYILISIAVTVAVNLCIVLILCLLFGSISYLTPISNLFMPFLSMMMLVLTLLVSFFGRLPILSSVLIFVTKILGGFILDIAEDLSALNNVVAPLGYDFADVILIALTIGVLLCLVLDLKKSKWLICVIPMVSLIAFFACLGANNFMTKDDLYVNYIRNGESEMLSLAKNGEYSIIDISNGGYKSMKAADVELNNLSGYEIDAYVLTHYHNSSVINLKRLSKNTVIRKVYIPSPQNYDEENVRDLIRDELGILNIQIIEYEISEKASLLKDVEFKCLGREYLKTSTHPTISFSLYYEDKEIMYLGESFGKAQYCENIDPGPELIIFGTHGPANKDRLQISGLINDKTECILFATDDIFESIDAENRELISSLKSCEIYKNVERKNLKITKK